MGSESLWAVTRRSCHNCGRMSVQRVCVFVLILACALYAAFILVYKRADAESVQHLREDVKAVIESNLVALHLAANEELALQPAVPEHGPVSHDPDTSHPAAPEHQEAEKEDPEPAKPVTSVPVIVESPDQVTCRNYVEKHAVVPGQSWGTMTIDQQKSWGILNCDALVQAAADKVAQIVAVEAMDRQETAAQHAADKAKEADAGGKKKEKEKARDEKAKTAALPSVNKDNSAWCEDVKSRYKVIPMRSWGQLPLNYIDQWKGRKCDLVFTAKRMGERAISFCADAGNGTTVDKKGKKEHSNQLSSLPLIAVMAATTTRKINKPSTKNLSLFMYLLPSLIRTLDCGFRYEYVLGYDKGDPFYDSAEGMAEVTAWFKSNVEAPMSRNGIKVTLRLVKVNNTMKKPGPVFLEMARAAYSAGADYFYRINDDTELMVNWPAKFVAGMQKLPAPYGVIGPLCSQGNSAILTHDFTARLHMEIFEMNYYPPELVDWWMDDWISLVYGQRRTFKAKSVPVMHHTGAHGQRYTVDQSNSQKLGALVDSGRLKIRQWMLTHNVPEAELKLFDTDVYRNFVHNDILS